MIMYSHFPNSTLDLLGVVLGRLEPTASTLEERLLDLRDQAVSLSDWHLLHFNPATETIGIHPLVKEYFAGFAKDPISIHKALVAWYVSRPVPQKPETLDQVRNRLLAVEHSLRANELSRCAELMFAPFTYSYSFFGWLKAWGHLSPAIELLGRLARAATGMLRGQFLIARSGALHQIARPQDALTDIDQAIADFEDHTAPASKGTTSNLARALASRGNLLAATGSTTRALADFDRAIKLFEGMSEKAVTELEATALTLVNRGNALLDLGRWTLALADYDRASQSYADMISQGRFGLEPMLAFALGNRGIVKSQFKQDQHAIDDFKSAEEIYTQLLMSGQQEHDVQLAHVRAMLAVTFAHQRLWAESLACLDQAVALLQRLAAAGRRDAEPQLALALMNRFKPLKELGRLTEALEDCNTSISIYQRLIADGSTHFTGSLAHTQLNRAETLHALGDLTGSKADRDEGITTIQKLCEELSVESDILIVFVEKTLASITYLLPCAPREALTLADELKRLSVRMLAKADCSEGLKVVISRVLDGLKALGTATD